MQFEEALKIYRKALSFSKENLSSNEQLVRNLTKVVNSATEQIEEQKRSLLSNVNKTMAMKESTLKSDIYKDLSKKVERYHKPLPKLKVNNREHAALYEPSYQSVDYNEEEPNIVSVSHSLAQASKTLKNRQRFLSQRVATKNQNAITPDSRGQL
jgi:cysteinyl-tRNA synthetase